MPRAYSTLRRTMPILRDGPLRPKYRDELLSCCDSSPSFDSLRSFLTWPYWVLWDTFIGVRRGGYGSAGTPPTILHGLLQLSDRFRVPALGSVPSRRPGWVFRVVAGARIQRRLVMDDRHLPRQSLHPHIVRTSEFSRMGKSLLASAYERVVPVARVSLQGNGPLSVFLRQQMPKRKVGA